MNAHERQHQMLLGIDSGKIKQRHWQITCLVFQWITFCAKEQYGSERCILNWPTRPDTKLSGHFLSQFIRMTSLFRRDDTVRI